MVIVVLGVGFILTVGSFSFFLQEPEEINAAEILKSFPATIIALSILGLLGLAICRIAAAVAPSLWLFWSFLLIVPALLWQILFAFVDFRNSLIFVVVPIVFFIEGIIGSWRGRQCWNKKHPESRLDY